MKSLKRIYLVLISLTLILNIIIITSMLKIQSRQKKIRSAIELKKIYYQKYI